MKELTILIPTLNRPTALLATLSSLCFQGYNNFDIVISDQSDRPVTDGPELDAVLRVVALHGHRVQVHRHFPREGIAEQRQFLLTQATTPFVLFLDDDLILEPFVVGNLMQTIKQHPIAFVGAAPVGLSFHNDRRPEELQIELWKGTVEPEKIKPGSDKWFRYELHNAANPLHVAENLKVTPDKSLLYKIAWVGGCVLYNRTKLVGSGGFSFWKDLPKNHCGEDVYIQLKLMEKYGGCAILPSGVYHQELPTTIPDREVNAPFYLSSLPAYPTA